jgi:hypothetical protein
MVLGCVAGLGGLAALLAIEGRFAASAASAFARAYLAPASSSAKPAPSADGRRGEISSLRRQIPQTKTMESQVGREGPWP